MRKDAHKKMFATKKTAKPKRLRWFFFASLLLFVLGAGTTFYQYKKILTSDSVIATNFAKISTWIAAHKTHLHDGLAKVKQIASNKDAEDEPIHFEFYTALPNMQVKVNTPIVDEAAPPKKKEVANNSAVKTHKEKVKLVDRQAPKKDMLGVVHSLDG